jgi:hypothetical protein
MISLRLPRAAAAVARASATVAVVVTVTRTITLEPGRLGGSGFRNPGLKPLSLELQINLTRKT